MKKAKKKKHHKAMAIVMGLTLINTVFSVIMRLRDRKEIIKVLGEPESYAVVFSSKKSTKIQ